MLELRPDLVSPNPLTDRVDHLAQAIAERVVNLVLEAVDIDRLIQRVDVNALVERVDLNALVERIDVNALLERVDVNALAERIDVDALVERTEVGSLIAKSTTSVMIEVLDLVRAQGVGLDDFVARWTNRFLRRPPGSLALGPTIPAPSPLVSTRDRPESGEPAGMGIAHDGSAPTGPGRGELAAVGRPSGGSAPTDQKLGETTSAGGAS